jgi:radical SAM protein with 4Fe4S-binding SPASM domain
MPAKYARLRSHWCLRGWADAPTTVANRATGEAIPLPPAGFYAARSCDGQTNFNSLAFLPDHHSWLDELIDRGIAAECGEGDAIEPWQRFVEAGNPCLVGIHWCVTGRCNMNCRHCYMESPSGRFGELPWRDVERMVEQFHRANVLQVSLTGGEPFMRQDLLDLLDLLAQKRIWVSNIYSNGLLITEEHLKAIRGMGLTPSFQISFDGVAAHDQMRGTLDAEARVIESIRWIRAAGFPVAVATCIDRINACHLPATLDLMKDLAIQNWRIASPQESGNWRGSGTALTLEEEAEACAPVMKRWLEAGRPFYLQLGGFFRGGRGGAAAARRPSMPEYSPDSFDCGSCRQQPNLLPDGTLLPCPAYVDSVLQERMPNLLREELSAAWSGSSLRVIADLRKRDVLAQNPECAGCEYFANCGTGCRAKALAETGDLLARDPVACALWKKGYKKRFQEMVQLHDSGKPESV